MTDASIVEYNSTVVCASVGPGLLWPLRGVEEASVVNGISPYIWKPRVYESV